MRTLPLVVGIIVGCHAALCADERHDPGRVQELIEFLAIDDSGVCFTAVNGLARLGPEAKPAVPDLIKLLGDGPINRGLTRDNIYGAAESAIEAIGSEAVDTLCAALKNESPGVRRQAARILGKIGPGARHVLPEILQTTRDSDPAVRREAMSAVLSLDREKGYSLLMVRLADGTADDRAQAVWGVTGFPERSEKIIPYLLTALDDADPCVRASAAGALGNLGKSAGTVVPALRERLKDRATYAVSISNHLQGITNVSTAAADALEAFGEKAAGAGPDLVAILADDSIDGPLADAAARALSALGPAARPFVPKLVDSLQRADVEPAVQRSILTALRVLGPNARAAAPALKKLFEQSNGQADSETDVSLDLACALTAIDREGFPAAWEVVSKELDAISQKNRTPDIDHFRREELLLGTLRQIGPAAETTLPSLIAMIENEPYRTYEIVPILCRIGPPASGAVPLVVRHGWGVLYRDETTDALFAIDPDLISTLIAGLDEFAEDRHHCIAIVQALGHLGQKSADAIPALVRLSRDDRDEHIRIAAAEALGEVQAGPDLSIPELIRLLQDPRPRVRTAAARSLGAYRAAATRANDALTAALKDEYIDVRAATAKALGEIGPSASPAIQALQQALSDRSAFVRNTAAESIAKLKK